MDPRLPIVPVGSNCQQQRINEASTSMNPAAVSSVPVRRNVPCQSEYNIIDETASSSMDPTPPLVPIRTKRHCKKERTIIMEDIGEHNLLRDREYVFSIFTLQRAFIAWTALGRQYHFNDVCKYYHFLEQHEATLPKPNQDQSRNLEYSHIHSSGMAADFLHYYFPTEISPVRIRVVMIPPHPTNMNDPILPASLLITSYLFETGRNLSEMLYAFRNHAIQEDIPASLINFVQYIRCLTIQHRKNKNSTNAGESIDEIIKGPFRNMTRRPVSPMAMMYMRMKAMNEEFMRRYRHSLPMLPRNPEPRHAQSLNNEHIVQNASTSADKQVYDEATGGDNFDPQTLALKRILDIK